MILTAFDYAAMSLLKIHNYKESPYCKKHKIGKAVRSDEVSSVQ